MMLGSLFSGSGGFELAASMCGIKPVWASEIEPFPILVTATRFPEMMRFGDIKKMDGNKIPKVGIITGGSPCQDMSIAGKRDGLNGSRSSLFREQIRIVKEMRESDRAAGRTGKQIRPRYMVWENVPGAFSSNKGEDFRCVLEEIIRISEQGVSVPRPPKGEWSYAGTIMGNGYSVAWRTLDAQYWGVPQRRRRIYLVADFGGTSAPEILFEREGLQRNSEESCKEGKGTACSARDSTEEAKAFHVTQDPISTEVSPCLTQGKFKRRAAFNQGENAKFDISIQENVAQTIVAKCPNAVAHKAYAMQGFGEYKASDTASSIKQRDFKDATDLIVEQEYIVRRLTPTECGRLQGFPDGWADNLSIGNPTEEDILYWKIVFKEHGEALGIDKREKTDNQIRKWLQNPESDSAKYKMWGNGIALPCAGFVMRGIVKEQKKRK